MKLSALLAPLIAAKADHSIIEQMVLAYEDDRTTMISSLVPPGLRLSSRQWGKVRARILERDECLCAYCGGAAATVDHVTPISLSGSNTDDNLVACCDYCNRSKGARPLADWKGLRQ